jgi:hypothetical protein
MITAAFAAERLAFSLTSTRENLGGLGVVMQVIVALATSVNF